MIFFLLIGLLIVLIHLYLWKRLVLDTTRPGRARQVGGLVVAGLTVLVFGTVIGSRFAGPAAARWFAWPGFVWFAVMAYLFVFLALLELPRLALRGWVRRKPLVASATAAPTADPATPDAGPA